MKKIIVAIILCIVLSTFTACAIPTGSGNNNTTENPGSTQTAGGTTTEKNEITFTELLVVDNDECTIKITGIEEDNLFGYTLKTYLENKSAEKTYMFALNNVSVNGIQVTSLFANEVAPGKKANEGLYILESALPENGIGDFTDIELSFRVYDSDDWTADEVAEVTAHVYPYGEDKVTKYVREAQSTDNVIVDNESVKVTVIGYDEDSLLGYSVKLFLENKTDKEVMFSADEASVNGFMANPIFATSVAAGKCTFSSMSWSDSAFEDNGITEVTEIEFTLKAYDNNDWFADKFAEEIIKLNP